MATKWHDDDRFWHTFGPALFTPEHLERAGDEIDRLLELVEAGDNLAVLDMACGPGRHAVALAQRGHRVTGVDRTTEYLDQARTRAKTAGVDVEWVEADMRELSRPGSFDLALSLYTAFGYFEDPKEDRRVAQHFFDNLAPGGILVMDTMSKEILAGKFRPRSWRELEDGSFLLSEATLEQDWGWVRSRWILVRQGQVEEHVMEHRLYAATELRALLTDVGFSSVVAYGSLEGIPFDHEAKRLVLVARK